MLQFEIEMQDVDRYISQNIFQNVLKIEQLYIKKNTYANVVHFFTSQRGIQIFHK